MTEPQDLHRLADVVADTALYVGAGIVAEELDAASEVLRRLATDPISIEVFDSEGNSMVSIAGEIAKRIHAAALTEYFERNLASH